MDEVNELDQVDLDAMFPGSGSLCALVAASHHQPRMPHNIAGIGHSYLTSSNAMAASGLTAPQIPQVPHGDSWPSPTTPLPIPVNMYCHKGPWATTRSFLL